MPEYKKAQEDTQGGMPVFSPRGLDMSGSTIRSSSFEKNLRNRISDMTDHEITRVVEAPGGRKVQVIGRSVWNRNHELVGAVLADGVTVQLDMRHAKPDVLWRSNAEVFVERSIYSKIESAYLKGEALPADDACRKVAEQPRLLGDELSYIPSIFKVLSDSKIQITHLGAKSSAELQETAEFLTKQHSIVSGLLGRGRKSEEEVLKGIRGYATAEEINNAFERYGLKKVDFSKL
jgi:hypothetical protein